MLVCCKSLKFAFNWVLRHWELEKIHKTNERSPCIGAVSFMQKMLTDCLHAATTPVVFTWWKLLKTRQQIWKCILPLSVSVRNHSRPVIKSHWSVTDILPTQNQSTWSRNCLCVTFAQQSWSCFYWKMKCKVFGSYFRISWIVLAWMHYAF